MRARIVRNRLIKGLHLTCMYACKCNFATIPLLLVCKINGKNFLNQISEENNSKLEGI